MNEERRCKYGKPRHSMDGSPYKNLCVECAVKWRLYLRKRMGAQSWSDSGRIGRKPLAEEDA